MRDAAARDCAERFTTYLPRMDTLLDTAGVCRIVGLSRQELWRRRRAGTFPEPVRLGGRRVGYSADEVQAWMRARLAERDDLLAARKDALK